MLNLNELLRNAEDANAALAALMKSFEISPWQARSLMENLEAIRNAVSAEIGRKAAVASGTGNAYKAFCRIIKNIEDNRPALKGAFYSARDHFLSVCDGYHAIRMFRDDFAPPMLPEQFTPMDLDKIYGDLDTRYETMDKIPLPSLQELRAFKKIETTEHRALYKNSKYDRWVPVYAIMKGDTPHFFNVDLLIDVLECIPDACAYGTAEDSNVRLTYCRGTDGDAVILPIRVLDADKIDEYVRKSAALLDGSFFAGACRKGVA